MANEIEEKFIDKFQKLEEEAIIEALKEYKDMTYNQIQELIGINFGFIYRVLSDGHDLDLVCNNFKAFCCKEYERNYYDKMKGCDVDA